MPEPTTPRLTESDVEALAAQDVELLDEWPEPVIVITPGRRDALIRDWRALKAALEAEDKDHRLTIDTFQRQERIWNQKYVDQEAENAALREQLAEAQTRILELETEIDTKAGYL